LEIIECNIGFNFIVYFVQYHQAETTDLANLAWSTNDSCIAIWDAEYNVIRKKLINF